jgi:hypothetical protein
MIAVGLYQKACRWGDLLAHGRGRLVIASLAVLCGVGFRSELKHLSKSSQLSCQATDQMDQMIMLFVLICPHRSVQYFIEASTRDRIAARSQIKGLQPARSTQLIGLVIVHGICDSMDNVIAIGVGLVLRNVIDRLTDSDYRLTGASCYK